MKVRVPDYYSKFKCIADKCEDTCCAGWEIVIDEETYDIYKNVKGSFGKRLKDEIVEDEGEKIFTLKGNNCAFLNKNKMCDIYTELGEDALCYTCQQFPRYTEEYGSIREVGISLSCPEAARIILNDTDTVEFEVSEDDEMVTAYNDISYEMFMQLMSARDITYEIIQNRSIDIAYRMAIVLNFAEEIQDKIDSNKVSEIAELRKKYSDADYLKSMLDKMKSRNSNGKTKYENIIEYFEEYKKLEHINEKWPIVINEAVTNLNQKTSFEDYLKEHELFNKHHKNDDIEYEQLMVYFIFRYFMKSVFDYDVIAKVKFAVVSYIMIKELDVMRFIQNEFKFSKDDQVDIMHMYSKDIEHCEENMEELEKILDEYEKFNLDNLLIMLLN